MKVGSESFDITPFVRRFIWTESLIRGGFDWSFTFQAADWTEWVRLLIGQDERPRVRFRLSGFQENRETTTDWRTAIIDGSKSSYKGRTLRGKVWGADRRLLMMQTTRERTWRERTVSEIAAAMATEYEMAAEVERVTPRRTRWQIRKDDWSYLRSIVARHAAASGRGDIFVWVDEETLRLGAPDLQAPSARRHDMSEVENRVDRLVVGYHGRAVDRAGGATLRSVGYDFDAKAGVVFTLGSVQAQTHPALGRRVPRPQENGLRVVAATEQGRDFVEGVARFRWGRAAPRYFSLRVETRPDLFLRPGAVLEAQATLGERQQSPLFGRYAVLEVRHELGRGGAITTVASCFRREGFEGEADPAGVSAAARGTTDRFRFGREDEQRVVLRAQNLDA